MLTAKLYGLPRSFSLSLSLSPSLSLSVSFTDTHALTLTHSKLQAVYITYAKDLVLQNSIFYQVRLYKVLPDSRIWLNVTNVAIDKFFCSVDIIFVLITAY